MPRLKPREIQILQPTQQPIGVFYTESNKLHFKAGYENKLRVQFNKKQIKEIEKQKRYFKTENESDREFGGYHQLLPIININITKKSQIDDIKMDNKIQKI